MNEWTANTPPPPPEAPTRKRRWPWAVGVPLALFLLIGVMADDDDADPAPAAVAEPTEEPEPEPEPEPEHEPEPEPEPDPEPEPEEGTYGSDPALDRLQDACEAGDIDACDDLYWDSPLGSEYEAFAQERRMGGDSAEIDDMDISDELVLSLSWMSVDPADQADFCHGYRTLGPDLAYPAFAEGWGDGAPSEAAFIEFYDERC